MKESLRAKSSPTGICVKCFTCQKETWVFPYKAKRERIFCSINCKQTYTVPLLLDAAHKATKGKTFSLERLAIHKAHVVKGEAHHRWKGIEVKYRAIHDWVDLQLGKPHNCELCGNDKLKHRQYHWANLSGQYMRDVNDWSRMCVKCHMQYDKIDKDFKKLLAITEMAY